MITFAGYCDIAHVGNVPAFTNTKSYSVTPADYATIAQQPIPSTLPSGVVTPEDLIAYNILNWALAKLDVPNGVDGNGQPIMKSFFDGATIVTV